LFQDEYLLKYFLTEESKNSPYLLQIEQLSKPFSYRISLILQQLARNIFGAPNVDVRSPRWLNVGWLFLEIFSSLQKAFYNLLAAFA